MRKIIAKTKQNNATNSDLSFSECIKWSSLVWLYDAVEPPKSHAEYEESTTQRGRKEDGVGDPTIVRRYNVHVIILVQIWSKSWNKETNSNRILWWNLGQVLEFFLNVSLNSANSVTKIFVITVKGIEPATSCVRDQDATTAPASKMPVKDRIFKLNPIHSSVIYQIPWLGWIYWIQWWKFSSIKENLQHFVVVIFPNTV